MVKAALPDDLTTLYPVFQAQWDAELLEARDERHGPDRTEGRFDE